MKTRWGLSLLLALAMPALCEEPIRLDYVVTPPGSGSPHSLRLTVTPTQTILREDGRVVMIDYERLELRREGSSLDPAASEARAGVYALSPPTRTAGRPAARGSVDPRSSVRLRNALADAAASYEITATRPAGSMAGFTVVEKTLWFGLGLRRARTAAPLSYPLWGMRFRERVVRFFVSDQHPSFPALEQIARRRGPVLLANPLLAQVDWTLLVPALGGLAVAIEESHARGLQITRLRTSPPQ